jgi:transcriptional regulator with XRE-family HTH domain
MKKEIGKRVGHRIKVRRTELDMSQGELAQALGISQGQMSYLEKGQRAMTLEMLETIARTLRCSISDLLEEKHTKQAA